MRKAAKHVLPALEQVKGKRHRRESIKALYAWLAHLPMPG
jgi:hypothetical protein